MMEPNPVSYKNLTSQSTRLLAKELGMQRAYEFLSEHWNHVLYIPPNLKRSKLAQKVGDDVANVLVKHYSGEYYQPSKPDKIFELWRNYEIVQDQKNGMKLPELAAKYDLTRQRINQITREIDPSRDQNFQLDFG